MPVTTFEDDSDCYQNAGNVVKSIYYFFKESFSKGEKWYDKLFNVKYLPLFHHFKAIYQFPNHLIFLIKIVAYDSLKK
jgi:hypothetical protein